MKQVLFSAIVFLFLLLLQSEAQPVGAQGPTPSGARVGKPWRGAPGIAETVAQIMAREQRVRKPAPGAPLVPREVPLRDRRNIPRTQKASQRTAPSASTQLLIGRLNPQTVGTSFLAVQSFESGFVPPDSMGAVGPTQVLVVVNGRIRVFDRSGNLGGLNADLSTFFAPSLGPTATVAFDPQARYDRLSGRWFVTALSDGDGFPLALRNRVMIAVSSSSTITTSTSFNFFQFQHDLVGTTPNADTDGSADYDSLGIDATSLYIGVAVFNSSGSFSGTTGFVVNKADLLASTLTVTAFRQLIGCCSGQLEPRGVQNDDPNASEGYFIGVDYYFTNILTIRRITYSGGIPAISSDITMTIPTTRLPISVPALGTSTSLDAIDHRLFAAQIHKNKLTGTNTLWTAHNIEVDSTGNACDDGSIPCTNGGRDGSRWYEIGSLTSTPALVQSGTLYDSATSNPRFYWFPSVAMSGQGHMALGASVASVNDYAGVAVAGRLFSDASGATQSPTIAQSGLGAYNLGSQTPKRWGDYSQTVVDPNDDMTMWTFQEYANATESWGVRVVQLKAPSPALPSFASPASVALGQSSVNVVITGDSVSGSGFFDPGLDSGGPGFANHITATVSSGVIVNSINFNTPTQITLNISTMSASNGAANVTVTNPDGQFSTGYCLLIVGNPSPAPSCRLSLPLIFK